MKTLEEQRNSGTPKTLAQAIQNGIDSSPDGVPDADVIEKNVKDYLSQFFTAAMISDWALTVLWEHIIRIKKGE